MITLAEKADIDQLREIVTQQKIVIAELTSQISSLKLVVGNLERNKADKVWTSTPLSPQPVWLDNTYYPTFSPTCKTSNADASVKIGAYSN